MPLSLLPLFYDVVNKKLVISAGNPDPFTLPVLNQEDSYTIQFQAVIPTGNAFIPFTILNLAGYSLEIAVGLAAVVNALASGFTPSADNKSLSGTLALNTAGINGLAQGAAQVFEIRLFDGTSYTRGQFNITINKSVNVSGALIPAPAEGALSINEAKRTYMRKEGEPGEGFILTSADGLSRTFEYLHNDASRRSDPIAP